MISNGITVNEQLIDFRTRKFIQFERLKIIYGINQSNHLKYYSLQKCIPKNIVDATDIDQNQTSKLSDINKKNLPVQIKYYTRFI